MVHLHVHTEYSVLDGAIRIKDLLKRLKALGHKACAITDHGNLFGAIEFYTKAKDAGIKAIIGAEIFHPGNEATGFVAVDRPLPQRTFHLVLLARSNDGYKNLIKLVSHGYTLGLKDVPTVPEPSLDALAGELIALSSCRRGEFGFLVGEIRKLVGGKPGTPLPLAEGALAEGHPALIATEALRLHVQQMLARFGAGNYFVELIDNKIPEQRLLLPDLVLAARHFGLPLVASADAHYLTKEHAESHAIQLGIKHSLTISKIRGRRKGTAFHLLDDAEMLALYGAWPEALANTAQIADRCQVEFKFGKYYLPKFSFGGEETPEEGVKRMARLMLEERFEALTKLYGPKNFGEEKRREYRDRLEFELDVICRMGFASYFLIVQDFINWAKNKGIPVGPGRGSGAGSIVAYALRITDLDPIPYNLLFERFLNPDRVSMPDFDVDFCQDRRGEVIDYVTQKYGALSVAQIATFGRMNAKAVVKDVGRVLELGYGRVDRFSKLIPEEIGITLDKALEKEPRIAEEMARDEGLAELWRLAKQLEGLARQTGMHAAGIVISDGPMEDYVPVFTAEGTTGLITQYEMKMAEKVGLVKFDFLGLKTLTVIERAVQLVRQRKDPQFDINFIPMADKNVYRLISDGHSVGVFQLESSGMKNLITKLKPSCFEDVIAVVALFRPGPLGSGMVEDFIERKHGRAAIDYPLPQLEDTLKETYGVILYQEQVMKIARELASYSLGEADLLRRAMGKKNAEEMAKQKERFVGGAVGNAISGEKAGEIFDLMAKFAEYGFNKSHSAAYGLITYQTAYLKQHFPDEFMAAIMTCDLDNTKKIVRYVDECRRMRLTLLPPTLNRSVLQFAVKSPSTLDFGLAAIKGLGVQALEPILAERDARGSFVSLQDFARRVSLTKVGKKTVEILAQSGALDEFGISRPKLMEIIPELVRFSEDVHHSKSSGQRGLFDAEAESSAGAAELSFELNAADRKAGAPSPDWLKKEKALLGVFLTGHPLQFHREDVRAFGKLNTSTLASGMDKGKVCLVAVLAMLNERLTKMGKRMASVRLEDEHGAVEGVMFEKEIPPEFPEAGTIVCAYGSVDENFKDKSLRFKIDKLIPVEEIRQEHVRTVTLTLRLGATAGLGAVQLAVERLRKHLELHRGDTPVKLVLKMGLSVGEGEARLAVPILISVSDLFLHGLGELPFAETKLSYQLYQTGVAAPPQPTPELPMPPGPAGDEIPLPEFY